MNLMSPVYDVVFRMCLRVGLIFSPHCQAFVSGVEILEVPLVEQSKCVEIKLFFLGKLLSCVFLDQHHLVCRQRVQAESRKSRRGRGSRGLEEGEREGGTGGWRGKRGGGEGGRVKLQKASDTSCRWP